MKTAEQWVKEHSQSGPLDNVHDAEEFIRAIQDDALSNDHPGIDEFGAGHHLGKAATQMNIADDPKISQSDRCYARDNATEHRRIAEAYIALAQAVKQ